MHHPVEQQQHTRQRSTRISQMLLRLCTLEYPDVVFPGESSDIMARRIAYDGYFLRRPISSVGLYIPVPKTLTDRTSWVGTIILNPRHRRTPNDMHMFVVHRDDNTTQLEHVDSEPELLQITRIELAGNAVAELNEHEAGAELEKVLMQLDQRQTS